MKSSEPTKRKRINKADVRASYRLETTKLFPIVVRVFGRPVADACTPFFYNLGITANQLTLIRIILYFLCLFGLFSSQFPIVFMSALGLFFAFVLDFVDGHLARLHDDASYFGKFVDGVADYLFPVFLSLPIALKFSEVEGKGFYLFTSILCGFLVLFNRLLRERTRAFTARLNDKQTSRNQSNESLRFFQTLDSFFSAHTLNTRMICILILFIPGAEEAFILVLLTSQFVTEIGWLIAIGGCAFYSLNHWKKSAAAN